MQRNGPAHPIERAEGTATAFEKKQEKKNYTVIL